MMKHNHVFSLLLLLAVTTAYVAKASDFVGPPKPAPVVVYPEHPTLQQVLVEIGCDPFVLTCTA